MNVHESRQQHGFCKAYSQHTSESITVTGLCSLNELNDPRLLSCGHVLCHKCLKDYVEKAGHRDRLPCPMCHGLTSLHEGGVDNLPKFFFMNELKEVVMELDTVGRSRTEPKSCEVCSTEDCGQNAVKYCQTGCQFLCQECYNEHGKSRKSKTHKVIPATEHKVSSHSNMNPYPACHRHQHKLLNLYCRACHLPVCKNCSNSSHRGHDCCELEEQAKVCKTKLEGICDDTDILIKIVREAIHKTRSEVK